MDVPTPRARLRIEQRKPKHPCVYTDPDGSGGASTLPMLRLMADVRVVTRDGSTRVEPEPALIDTGADVSVIEESLWRRYARLGLVQPLPFAAPPGRS